MRLSHVLSIFHNVVRPVNSTVSSGKKRIPLCNKLVCFDFCVIDMA
jgi:hypothetical protein